jgi:RNA polymerase sigma-70 factor (family 1)
MLNLSKLTDKELVELVRQNNPIAFKEIYDRYWKKLFSEAYKRLKSKEIAEEIVQDLFTRLWIKRHTLVIKSELSAYFRVSIAYFVIDQYRKNIIKERYRNNFKIITPNWNNSTEEEILLRDLNNTIALKVSQLPDKCRHVYELSRVEHKSNKEIAQSLGISKKTVENHLTKALKALQLELLHCLLALFLFIN